MKKILITIFLTAITLIGFAQRYDAVWHVPDDTTKFGRALAKNTIVFSERDSNIYVLLAAGTTTSSLSTVSNYAISHGAGWSALADSAKRAAFVWKIDTTHRWGYLLADSINSTAISFSNLWGGNIRCDSIWATTHYAVSAFDTVQTVDTINANIMRLLTFVLATSLSTSDSIAVFSNDTLRYRLASGLSVLYADSAGLAGVSDTSFVSGVSDTSFVSGVADTAFLSGTADYSKLTDSTHSYFYFSIDSIPNALSINGDVNIFGSLIYTPILSASDTMAVFSNDTLKYKLLDMTPYLKFSDTTSTLLTQITAGNTYQLIGDYTEFSDTTSTLLTQITAGNTYQLIGDYTEFSDTTSTLLTQSKAGNTYQLIGDYTTFADTTSTLLTQSKASNTYQLKYWSRTGTALTPYTSTDTIVSKYQRISGMFPTATTLLEVTSTGLLDTIASTPISPIYVKKAGDTLNGDFHLVGGTFSLDTYAATAQKSLITQPSGLIDTVPMVTIDDAVISSITLTDSISIGGIVTISDTILVADEDSIYFKRGKSGWACIYADSSGTIVAWANFYWDSNGTPHLQNNSSRVIASDTDTNVICLYAYGSGLVMRNRSGSTMKFKTVLNY